VVTSSVAAEGKTTVATNLAAAMVAANRRVLLIEADLRRPTLDEYFNVDRGIGLTDVLVGHAEVDDAMQSVGFNGLMLLPSGQLPPNPSELLGSNAMVELLQRMRFSFDSIIINTPPLLPVTDAAVLSAHADGVLVVVRAAKTTRHQLMLAMRSLQAVGARVLGTVFNMSPSHRGSSYEAYWQTGTGTPANARPAMEVSRSSDAGNQARPTIALPSALPSAINTAQQARVASVETQDELSPEDADVDAHPAPDDDVATTPAD
jgi:capsular exopolysaccharide synthesis family protein